ncbi:hypothetical protein DRO54_12095 [Candidatus Bathyarchaeota archaeon]|nr:MAG: hypothetical protein DRO54_12095 [Candidatus Bathyarchaeota archaeon]
MGIVCGSVFHLFKYDALVSMVPVIAPLTIAFISFDAGLKMDFYEAFEQSRRAIILSVVGFILSLVIVGLFLLYICGLEPVYAFMLASAWSGVNTATVNAVCNYLKLKEKTHTTLIISSLVDDAVVLVSTLTILNFILLGEIGFRESLLTLTSNFCISIFIGVTLGLAWMNILYFSRTAKYTYTFTLAAILLVYSVTETLGGTGGIAVFIFGLILGNSRSLASALKLKLKKLELSKLTQLIENFHSELTFIICSFFFTFIGLIYVFTGLSELLLGLGVGFLLHLTRLLAVKIGVLGSSLASDFPVMGLIVGKGVASAAMSTLPLAYGLPNAAFYTSIALNVILFTNLISVTLPLIVAKIS